MIEGVVYEVAGREFARPAALGYLLALAKGTDGPRSKVSPFPSCPTRREERTGSRGSVA